MAARVSQQHRGIWVILPFFRESSIFLDQSSKCSERSRPYFSFSFYSSSKQKQDFESATLSWPQSHFVWTRKILWSFKRMLQKYNPIVILINGEQAARWNKRIELPCFFSTKRRAHSLATRRFPHYIVTQSESIYDLREKSIVSRYIFPQPAINSDRGALSRAWNIDGYITAVSTPRRGV